MVRKHQELLQRLDEESAAKARLVLELHKAEGEAGGVAGGGVLANVWRFWDPHLEPDPR